MCPAGWYSPPGCSTASSCIALSFVCPAGKFQMASGATGNDEAGACLDGCVPGKYDDTASVGATNADGFDCKPCPAGYESGTLDKGGSTTCTACAAGQYDHDSSSLSECEACPVGTFGTTDVRAPA